MHSLSLAATTLFFAGALAGNLNQLLPRELQVRQGSTTVQGPDQSYQPDIIQGGSVPAGTTCADLYGAGSFDCGTGSERLLCYNPGRGETCCNPNGARPYYCLSGEYCFVDSRCCPNGLSAQTCADQFNIPLPEDFSTDTPSQPSQPSPPSPPNTPSPSSTPSPPNPVGPTTSPVIPTPIPLPSPIPDTAPYPIPSPIPGNATLPGGPAAPTGTGALPPVVPFTGAAGNVKVYCGVLLAGALGVAGMVL
ncbi:MAG: hypothetical protein Q9208_006259 [Pyrenodesmia sp. 3 TL-2023]